MRKINSVRDAAKWVGVGLLVAVILPGVVWLVWKVFQLALALACIGILVLVCLYLWGRMRNSFGDIPFRKKHLRDDVRFDPATQEAVVRVSTCTGEKIAGFKDLATGHFTEVMVIRSPEDERIFMSTYNIDEMRVEY